MQTKKKGWKSMKKIIITSILTVSAIPVFATCPIEGGSCTAFSNWEAKSLQQKYLPNHVQEIQKPNAFQPSYITPYHNELINTETGNSIANPPASDYNSNCQFGVCLPDVEGGENVFE